MEANIFYRRGGRKDGKLLKGTIHSVDQLGDTITIKNGENILVTRNLEDIVRPYKSTKCVEVDEEQIGAAD